MYSSNQTLVKIGTNDLYALHPKVKGDIWNWELGQEKDKTRLIDSNGEIIFDDIDNYTHISDEFDRASFTPKGIRINKYVDDRLYAYLSLTDKDREDALKEAIENKIITLKKEERVSFCDGSRNHKLYMEFIKYVNAKNKFVTVKTKHSLFNNLLFFKLKDCDYVLYDYCAEKIRFI